MTKMKFLQKFVVICVLQVILLKTILSDQTLTTHQEQQQSKLYVFRGVFNCSTNATDAEIEANILNNFQPINGTIYRQVAANLKRTKKWEPCWEWSHNIGETTCPYQVSKSKLPRVNRLPDAIAIGAAKGGTGSLSFLDCHPDIRFRLYEPDAYPRGRHFLMQ